MELSPTVKSLEIKNKLEKEGKQIYNLGLGENPMPIPIELKKVLLHTQIKNITLTLMVLMN